MQRERNRILRALFGDVLTHYYPKLDAWVARYRSELATDDQFKAMDRLTQKWTRR